MLITIDTNNVTPRDLKLLGLLSEQLELTTATSEPAATATPEPVEKPVRKRRTKAQMEADEAALKAEAETAAPAQADPATEQDEPTPDSENAEADAPEPISIEEFSELCSKLIAKDRAAFKGLLDEYGVARATLLPDEKRGEFIDKVRGLLG